MDEIKDSGLAVFLDADSPRGRIERFISAVEAFSVFSDPNSCWLFPELLQDNVDHFLPNLATAIQTLAQQLAQNLADPIFEPHKFLLISDWVTENQCGNLKRNWPELRAKLELVALNMAAAEATAKDQKADSSEVRAHHLKLFPKGTDRLERPFVEFVRAIDDEPEGGRSQIKIAEEHAAANGCTPEQLMSRKRKHKELGNISI